MLLAIDPGTTMSAFCIMAGEEAEDGYEPYEIAAHGKVENADLRGMIGDNRNIITEAVIEVMESRIVTAADGGRGAVGRETYVTCEWIGRYKQVLEQAGIPVHDMTRNREKSNLIPTKKNRLPPLPEPVPRSADAKIRMSLIRRFARHDKVNGKGNAKNPDWFYGVKADVWQAYGIGVTYLDERRRARLDGQRETAGSRKAKGRSRLCAGKTR